MKLYIVRHGETDANKNGIVQGWLDTELNQTGVDQAVEVAANFNKTIDVIFSSDLRRAVQTAREFRVRHGDVPYFEDQRLRERDFGDAAGTHRDNHDWEQFWSINDRSTIPNAEILNHFTERIRSFLGDLETMPYAVALIVTHGGVLNRVQAILDNNHKHHPHVNAAILEIDIG